MFSLFLFFCFCNNIPGKVKKQIMFIPLLEDFFKELQTTKILWINFRLLNIIGLRLSDPSAKDFGASSTNFKPFWITMSSTIYVDAGKELFFIFFYTAS